MEDYKKEFEILGVKVSNLPSPKVLNNMIELARSTSLHQVVTVNPEFLVRANYDSSFKTILNRADLAPIDGAGIVFWGKILGKSSRIFRASGVDLVYSLAEAASREGFRIFLLGGQPGVAQKAADKLLALFPRIRIVGADWGGHISDLKIDPALEKKIKRAHPHILLVAFGHPKQEKWIDANRKVLGVPLAMGVGGTLDFISGRIKRAPLLMRRIGLEWLYRLFKEPERVVRIWQAVVIFSLLALREKSRSNPHQGG